MDYSGKDLKAGSNDLVFVYATITDKNGTAVHNANDIIEFKATRDAEVIGENPRAAEAGTAIILLKVSAKAGKIYYLRVQRILKTVSLF